MLKYQIKLSNELANIGKKLQIRAKYLFAPKILSNEGHLQIFSQFFAKPSLTLKKSAKYRGKAFSYK